MGSVTQGAPSSPWDSEDKGRGRLQAQDQLSLHRGEDTELGQSPPLQERGPKPRQEVLCLSVTGGGRAARPSGQQGALSAL